MIVGIGIGGSTTDAVLLDNGEIVVVTIETGDPLAAAAGSLGKLLSTVGGALADIQAIASISETLATGTPAGSTTSFLACRWPKSRRSTRSAWVAAPWQKSPQP